MMNTYLLADLADELLREYGQNYEYPYLTRDRMRRIAAHEIIVPDVEAALQSFTTANSQDLLRNRERARPWKAQ